MVLEEFPIILMRILEKFKVCMYKNNDILSIESAIDNALISLGKDKVKEIINRVEAMDLQGPTLHQYLVSGTA